MLRDVSDPTCGGMQSLRVIYDRSAEDEKRLAAMQESAGQAAAVLGARLGSPLVHPPGVALHHEIGGLRMSDDARSGVTDTCGQFWQVQNLSAADASVFPSQGAANPAPHHYRVVLASCRRAGPPLEQPQLGQ